LSGEDVDGEAAVPEGDSDFERGDSGERDQVPSEADFENGAQGDLGFFFSGEEADAGLLDGMFRDPAGFDMHDDDEIRIGILDAEMEFALAELLKGAGDRVHTEEERVAVEAVAELVQVMCAAMHGGFLEIGGVESGAEPFEIAGFAAVHGDAEEIGRRKDEGALRRALDGLGEGFGGFGAEGEVDFGEVGAVDGVELGVVDGAVFGAVPPAPVAALGGEQRFVGVSDTLGSDGGGAERGIDAQGAFVDFVSVAEEVPGADVLGMAGPDVEIRVDPGAGDDVGDGGEFAGSGDRFRGGERADIGVSLDAGVETAEEIAAIAGEILPGVLAVENEGNSERAIGMGALADGADAAMKVFGGGVGGHAAVNKADEVGEIVVAEQADDVAGGKAEAPGRVEALRVIGNAGGVAAETDLKGAAEDAFVAGKPAETELGGDGEGGVGDGAFRRPEACGGIAEMSDVETAGAKELFAGVFGMDEGRRDVRGARIGFLGGAGVAQERKDGVIEGRGGKFDLAALSGGGVLG